MNFRTFCVPLLAAAAFFVHPGELLLGGSKSETPQFDRMLRAAGPLARIAGSPYGNKKVIPYDITLTQFIGFVTQEIFKGPEAFDDGNASTDERFVLGQAGPSNLWGSTVMQVKRNVQTAAGDSYSMPQDRWSTSLNSL